MEFDTQKLNEYHLKGCLTVYYDISGSHQKLKKDSIPVVRMALHAAAGCNRRCRISGRLLVLFVGKYQRR